MIITALFTRPGCCWSSWCSHASLTSSACRGTRQKESGTKYKKTRLCQCNQMTQTMTQLEAKKKKSDNTYKQNAWLQSVSWPNINWGAHKHPHAHHARAEVDQKEIHIRACFSHPISNIHNYEIRGKLHYKDLHKHSWAARGSFGMFFFFLSLFLLLTRSVFTPPFCLHHMLPHFRHHQNRDSSLQAATPFTSCHSAPTDIDLFPVPHPSPCSFYAILDKGTRPRAAIGKFNYPSVT